MPPNPTPSPSIIELLRKIKALADRGVNGEATAARAALDKLLRKHHLKAEDILSDADPHECIFKVRDPRERQLLIQIVGTLLPGNRVPYKQFRNGRTLFFDLTRLQEAEVRAQFAHYRPLLQADWKKLAQTFVSAFILRNHIYGPDSTGHDRELTPEEYQELMQVLALAQGLTRKPWLKTKALLT